MVKVKSFMLLGGVLAVFVGCGARAAGGHDGDANPEAGVASPQGPQVNRVTPDSVRGGEAYPVVLTIEGRGFDRERNILKLGNVLTDTVPSATGSSIRWEMPKVVRANSEAPPMVVQAGRYELTVQTAEGLSNPVIVTVTPER